MPKWDIADFITCWSAASASERSNSQRFLLELCEQLGIPQPDHHLDGTTSQGPPPRLRRSYLLPRRQGLRYFAGHSGNRAGEAVRPVSSTHHQT